MVAGLKKIQQYLSQEADLELPYTCETIDDIISHVYNRVDETFGMEEEIRKIHNEALLLEDSFFYQYHDILNQLINGKITHYDFCVFWSQTVKRITTDKDFGRGDDIEWFIKLVNMTYAYVQDGNRVVYVNSSCSNQTLEYYFCEKSLEKLKAEFSMYDIWVKIDSEEKEKSYNLYDLIVKCVFKRKTYRNTKFVPYSTQDHLLLNDEFNLFRGFLAKKLNQIVSDEQVMPFIDYTKMIICGKELGEMNDKLSNWLLDWWAHKIQFPEKKTRCCPVLRSNQQQVGKGVYVETFLENIVSKTQRYWWKPNTVNQLKKSFNGAEFGKLFCYIDEVKVNRGDKELVNLLKQKITSETIQIEKKYQETFDTSCYQEFIMLSNEEDPTPVDENNARYVVFDVSSDVKNQSKSIQINDKHYHGVDFFVEYKKWFESNRDIIFTWLLQRKINLPITNIPITKFMEQQIEIAKDEGDNVDTFLADHLQSLLTDNKLLNLKFTMNEPLHCLAEWHEFKTKFETALYTVSGSKGDFDISVLRENLVYHKPSDKMTITDVLLKTICEKITKKKLDQKGHNSLVARMSRINLFESNNIKLKEKNVKRWYLK
jgi:hypothetical protein